MTSKQTEQIEPMEVKFIKVGVGTPTERLLEVKDFVCADFVGDRTVEILKLEDSTVTVSIINPIDSGRDKKQVMLLTRESLIGLWLTMSVYLQLTDKPITDLITEVSGGPTLSYTCSPNIANSDK